MRHEKFPEADDHRVISIRELIVEALPAVFVCILFVMAMAGVVIMAGAGQ